MELRQLGSLKVSAVGYGCMGFSHGYGAGCSEQEAVELMRTACSLGCNFFDTAEGYLQGENEKLVGRALKPVRSQVILATKFQFAGSETAGNLKAEITRHLHASLKRLDTDYVDVYYYHRIHPNFSLAEVADAMVDLRASGLIREWGVSQADGEQIRSAHGICPLGAVQNEYSMMERQYEAVEMPLCRELGIAFVAFSPMGAGFLSGAYKAGTVYTGDDVRRAITRFKDENMRRNEPLLELLEDTARAHQATKAQIALAWILGKCPCNVPIPGMRTRARLEENLGAAELKLSDADVQALDEALQGITIYGNRTDEDIIAMYAADDKSRPGALKPEDDEAGH